jgi:hypothetical protein
VEFKSAYRIVGVQNHLLKMTQAGKKKNVINPYRGCNLPITPVEVFGEYEKLSGSGEEGKFLATQVACQCCKKRLVL